MPRSKPISENSRKYTECALGEVKDIFEKFPTEPTIANLNDTDFAWLQQKIQIFFEDLKETHYIGFSFRHKIGGLRNALAHQTSITNKENFQEDIKNLYEFKSTIIGELENNIKKSNSQREKINKFERNYSKNFGNDIQKKQLVDAMDSHSSNDETPIVPFPKTQASDEVQKYYNQLESTELFNYVKKKPELKAQITEEIIENLSNAYDEIALNDSKNPFYEEFCYINNLKKVSYKTIIKSLEKISQELQELNTGKDNNCNFDFYKNKFKELNKQKNVKDFDYEQSILLRNFIKDLEKSLNTRYTNWQLNEIDKRRQKYLAELYKKLENFKRLEQSLAPFFKGKFGRLLDLSSGAKSIPRNN